MAIVLPKECIGSLPGGICNWIQQEPVERIATIFLENEVVPDGYTTGTEGQVWQRWKPGNHRTVRIVNDDHTSRSQRFVCINGAWTIEEDQHS